MSNIIQGRTTWAARVLPLLPLYISLVPYSRVCYRTRSRVCFGEFFGVLPDPPTRYPNPITPNQVLLELIRGTLKLGRRGYMGYLCPKTSQYNASGHSSDSMGTGTGNDIRPCADTAE